MNDDDEVDKRVQRESDDELGFFSIKEESVKKEVREEKSLVSQVEKEDDWTIDSGCSIHMTADMNKFIDFNSCDGRIVRFGNNVTCHIKGIGSITLDGKTNTYDIHLFDGLKHNLISVGYMVDKGY